MQFQRALIGGLLGAVVGIILLVASRLLFGFEHSVVAIVVAIAVGLGVRSMVATRGHASYARGALAGLLAILAFLGGEYLVVEIAGKQAAANREQALDKIAPPPLRPLESTSADESEPAESEAVDESEANTAEPAAEAEAEVPAVTAPQQQAQEQTTSSAPRPASSAVKDPVAPLSVRRSLSTLDYVLLCVAAFVAYELGRGTGAKATAEPAVEPAAPAAD